MGANYTWVGADLGDPNDWNDPTNWLANGVPAATPPGPNDNVTISAGVTAITVNVTGGAEVASLATSASTGGSVDLTGSFSTASLGVSGLLELSGSVSDSGTATFADGATLDGGTTGVQGAASFGSSFTLESGELDLSTSSTATLSTLTLSGAVTLSGNITTTSLSDTSATSVTLGSGTLGVTSSTPGSPASLAALTIEGDTTLAGAFSSTSLTVTSGATLNLNAGDSLTATSALFDPSGGIDLTDGTLLVTGNATLGSSLTLSGGGSFTVDGTVTTDGGSIGATSNSRILVGAINGSGASISLSADATSVIELGSENTATTGTITVDSATSIAAWGNLSAPAIVVNGTLGVANGEGLTLSGSGRGLTGSGIVQIGLGSSLAVDGVDPGASDTVQIQFLGSGGVLLLTAGDLDAFGNLAPTIRGLTATDVIDFSDSSILTAAHCAGGVLDLYAGSTAVASLNVGNGYADQFSVLAIGGSTWQIDYLGGGTSAAPAGTTTQDSYNWSGPVAGAWNVAANWSDTTAAQSPATLAPGANDRVTVAAAANGAAQVLLGNANAYGLTLDGLTLLDGIFKVGAGGLALGFGATAVLYAGSSLGITGNTTLASNSQVTLNGGILGVTGTWYGGLNNYYGDQTVIENGGSLTVATLVGDASGFVIDAGSSFTVKGNASDTGGNGTDFTVSGAGALFTVKGTFSSSEDSIDASGGGQVVFGGLTEVWDGVTLGVSDALSSITIGKGGSAGALTLGSGLTVTEAGEFYAPAIVVNGALVVSNGQSLTLDGSNRGLTGSGLVEIGSGAALTVNGVDSGASDTVQLKFLGPGGDLLLTSSDLDALGNLVPTIRGFTATDVIDFTDYGDALTAAHYAGGILSLYAGTAVVASLNIGAGYSDQFSLLALPAGSIYQIDYLGGGTNAAPAGTTAADSYTWNGPVAGAWNVAANWSDTTAAQTPAAMAPGANDSVTIDAAANSAAQVLIGNGNAYGLTLDGQTLLDGVFKVGAGGLSVVPAVSTVLYAGSSLGVTGNATFADNGYVVLNGGVMAVTGTFNGGFTDLPYLFQNVIENGGSLTVGALVDDGSAFLVASGGVLTAKGNVSDTSIYGTDVTVDGAGSLFSVKGSFVSTNDYLYASNGGQIVLSGLMEDSSGTGVDLTVADASSAIAIGKGGGAAGTLTIGQGTSVTESGSFSAPSIVIKGTLSVGADQSLSLSATSGAGLTGSGIVQLGAGSSLTVNGVDTSAADTVQIRFAGQSGALTINQNDLDANSNLVPTIRGFGATDVIDFTGSSNAITAAHYAGGILSLYSGSAVAAAFNVGPGYKDQFSVLGLTGGSTWQIDYLGGGTNAAPAGTTSADSYTWSGPVAGAWNVAANWSDTTAAQTPAAMAPGANDSVTIDAAANSAAQVLIGNGNAYGLTLDGQTLLDGVFKVGAGGLSVAPAVSTVLYAGSSLGVTGNATFADNGYVVLNGGVMAVTGTFNGGFTDLPYLFQNVIENGGSLTVGALVDDGSAFLVASGGVLTAKGNVSDTSIYGTDVTVDGAGSLFSVKGSFVSTNDYLYASNGGQIVLSGLMEDSSGTGVDLTVADASSAIAIGKGGGAAGTLTIGQGTSVTESGSFSAPSIVIKGTLSVGAGQSLSLTATSGAGLTGSGIVQLGTNASLGVNGVDTSAADTVQLKFAGAGGVLTINQNDLDANGNLTPLIRGFGATNSIDVSGETLTSASYLSANGTLTLYDGTSPTVTLNIGTGYQGSFSVLPLTGGSTYQINYLGNGTSGAPAGTTAPDNYQWIGAVAGMWKTASSWTDTTAGQSPATLAPGANDSVTIGAAANNAAQVLIGNGNAYGLTLEGETLLDGVFKVVGTGSRGGFTVEAAASTVLYAGSSLGVTGDATFGNNAHVVLNGGVMQVKGTFYGGYTNLYYLFENTIENGGSLTVGALVDTGSAFLVASGSQLTVTGNVSDAAGDSTLFTVDGAGSLFIVRGSFVSTDDYVYASNGGQVTLAGLAEDVNGNGISLTVSDSSSSITIGKGGAAGALTIGANLVVTEAGSLSAPSIVVKGTLGVAANEALTLSSDGLTGSGIVKIGAGASLTLDGVDTSAADTVELKFAGNGGALSITTSDLDALGNLTPAILGFTAADVIDVSYAALTAAHYADNILTLYDGSTAVAALNIGAGYTDQFAIVPLPGSPTIQVDYLGASPAAAPAGTTSPDNYQWVGPVAGAWNALASWADTTTGLSPPAQAPGANDSVTIAAAASNAAQVIVGNANAHGLTLEGVTLLDGAFAVGAGGLNVTQDGTAVLYGGSSLAVTGNATFATDAQVLLDGGAMTVSGTLYAGHTTYYYIFENVIENGGSLTVGALSGNGSLFALSTGGILTDNGGVSDEEGYGGSSYVVDGTGSLFTVKGTFVSTGDSITVSNGGQAALGTLVQDVNGDGLYLTVQDSSSSITIGKNGVAGTLTIGSTSTVTESGTFSAPTILVKGTLDAAAGATLELDGAIAGHGAIGIDAGATLVLSSASIAASDMFSFAGAGGTVQLENGGALASFAISGFASSEEVVINGSWSFESFSENAGATVGTLTVTDGSHDLALQFAGSFASNNFAIGFNGYTTAIDWHI